MRNRRNASAENFKFVGFCYYFNHHIGIMQLIFLFFFGGVALKYYREVVIYNQTHY